jgi:hypothetical protein
MTFIHARWTDDEQTMIRAERGDGRVVFIPPEPGNADYRLLVEGDGASPPVIIAPAPAADRD